MCKKMSEMIFKMMDIFLVNYMTCDIYAIVSEGTPGPYFGRRIRQILKKFIVTCIVNCSQVPQ